MTEPFKLFKEDKEKGLFIKTCVLPCSNDENQIKDCREQTYTKENEEKLKKLEEENQAILEKAEELYMSDSEKYAREQQKQLEILNQAKDKKLITDKQYAAAKLKIEEATTKAQIAGVGDTLAAVSEAAGKGTTLGKAAAIASTWIKTYESAMSAYSSMAAIPVIGPALGVVAAAAAAALGLKSIQQIMSVQPPEKQKMEYGGFIVGPSHTNGGANVNAEGGELMMSKMAVSRNPQIASMVLGANQNALGGSSAKTLTPDDVAMIAAQVVKAVPVQLNETDRDIERRRIDVREKSFTI